MSMVVVLPAPLGPRKATISPCSRVRSMPRTAWTEPKSLVTPEIWTAGTGAGGRRRASPRGWSVSWPQAWRDGRSGALTQASRLGRDVCHRGPDAEDACRSRPPLSVVTSTSPFGSVVTARTRPGVGQASPAPCTHRRCPVASNFMNSTRDALSAATAERAAVGAPAGGPCSGSQSAPLVARVGKPDFQRARTCWPGQRPVGHRDRLVVARAPGSSRSRRRCAGG